MNDVVVDYKYTREISKYEDESDNQYKTYRESFSFTTYQNYAALHSGLAFTLSTVDKPSNMVFKKRKRGSSIFNAANFEVESEGTIILTNDINNEIGTEYLVELTYEGGTRNRSTVKPFIFRPTHDGLRLEVHILYEAPTTKVDLALFCIEDDLSRTSENIWYVREGNYPFAFYLANGDINSFKNTLLNSEYERKPIEDIYPKFLEWSTSKGASNADWYK